MNNLQDETYQVQHYATYYLGCLFFGMIDNSFGKDTLLDALKNPSKLVPLFNDAVSRLDISEGEKQMLTI